MGSGTLSVRANGQTIDETWFNQLRTAIHTDLLPRNSSGIVTDLAGSLGDSTHSWLYHYVTQLKLTANGNILSVKAPSSLAASYNLTLPGALPNSTIKNGIISLNNDGTTSINLLAGMIFDFGGATVPDGFLACDGTSYLRATYPDLFAAIGTAWGTADGTHFNVPDLRGRFSRGMDGSAGVDPDKLTRTAANAGGNTGNNVGSIQADAFKSHQHNVSLPGAIAPTNGFFGSMDGTDLSSTTHFTNAADATGDNETRPVNAYVNKIIKI